MARRYYPRLSVASSSSTGSRSRRPSTAMPVTQSFEESLEQFRNWLSEIGCSDNVHWVFNEDVTLYRGRYWIRTPLPTLNAELAKKQYTIGIERCLGLKLCCLCRCEEDSHLGPCSACYVFVPDDEQHSEQSLSGPESLAFCGPATEPSPMARPGRTTANGFVWWYLRKRKTQTDWTEMVPKRATVESSHVHDQASPV